MPNKVAGGNGDKDGGSDGGADPSPLQGLAADAAKQGLTLLVTSEDLEPPSRGVAARAAQFIFQLLTAYVLFRYLSDVIFERRNHADGVESFDIEAVKKAAEIVLWFLSGLVSLWMMWVNLLSLGLFSGLIGAGLTIAFRDLLSNMFAGLFLHWDKSIRIGDVIRTSKGITGRVEDIRVQTHYSHQMTAAARAIAAMKFLMLRSKRVAIRRQSLRRQNMRSMMLRCL